MMRIEVLEGDPLNLDSAKVTATKKRLEKLRTELRPRLPFLSSDNAILNLVGSVQVTPELVIDIRPKTRPEDDWVAAVLDLLTDQRVTVEGETRRAERTSRRVLADALAVRYADVLERALWREGPLLMMERRRTSRSALTGRLDVTQWVVSRTLRPDKFPQAETAMTVDNVFTSAISWVAEALAIRCSEPRLAARLRSLKSRVRPGLPPFVTVDPGVVLRGIPAQWRGYQPAWSIAQVIIRQIAPLQRSGVLEGLGLAIESWPLLERLLWRSLEAAAQLSTLRGTPLTSRGHSVHPLLQPHALNEDLALGRLLSPRRVEPDGSLWRGDELVATFEAKYSRVRDGRNFRDHYFQALATAGAMGAPVAVLVYPEASGPVSWQVPGFHGKPARLVAVGLDLYGYRRGCELERGELLLQLIG